MNAEEIIRLVEGITSPFYKRKDRENVHTAIRQLCAERDAFLDAVRSNWVQRGMRQGRLAYSCLFCNRWSFKNDEIEHATNCIVLRT